jgi:hypothetical protein
MAIVIEEEKQSSSGAWVAVLMWVIFIVALAAGFYYVFVKKQELIPIATPAEFKDTEQISKLPLNPSKVLQNPQFQSLKIHVNENPVGITGRANPFLGF